MTRDVIESTPSAAEHSNSGFWVPRMLNYGELRAVQAGSRRELQFSGDTMGTSWSARVAGIADMEAQALRDHIESVFERVIAEFSPWDPNSAICQWNHAPAGTWVPMSPEMMEVVSRSLDIHRRSDGAFHPGLGHTLAELGFGARPVGAEPPDLNQLIVDAHRLAELQCESGRLYQPGGLQLDLCGIAKGWAVDRTLQHLRQLGATGAFVEIGGDASAFGCHTNGLPWVCELETPGRKRSTLQVALSGMSVATSGDTHRYREISGVRFAHVIDPRSLQLRDSTLRSVSVFAERCMDADAWATALLVMGVDTGLAFAREHELAAVFMCERTDGSLRLFRSPTIEKLFELE